MKPIKCEPALCKIVQLEEKQNEKEEAQKVQKMY